MNHLNSILLEGVVVANPKTENGRCDFKISSQRYFMNDDEFEKELSYFHIATFGKITKMCAEKLKPGITIRVVGRLRQEISNGKTVILIVANHVEFKPVFNKVDKL